MSDDDAATDLLRIPVPVPESTIDMPDLIVSVELDNDSVSDGEDLHGVAHLSNHGLRQLAFVTGAVLGGIRTEHGYLAGDFAGPIAPVGIVVDLGAGETRELHVLVGTGSCGPDTVVPPGRYETVIRIPITFQDQNGILSAHHLLVRPGPLITIRAPRPPSTKGRVPGT
ncbi:MAG: hypothetical protein ACLP1E_07405 [Acidimicrobiales bacterium]